MTIDDRLGKLAERQEALRQSVELPQDQVRHLAIIAEQNEIRSGSMQDAITRLANAV